MADAAQSSAETFPSLVPGLHWDNTCSKNPELCPFYKKRGRSLNKMAACKGKRAVQNTARAVIAF